MRSIYVRWIAIGAAAVVLVMCLVWLLFFYPRTAAPAPQNATPVGQNAAEVET